MTSPTTLAAYRATLASLNERIAGSDAYLIHARGRDKQAELRHRTKLRRERDAVLARIGELMEQGRITETLGVPFEADGRACERCGSSNTHLGRATLHVGDEHLRHVCCHSCGHVSGWVLSAELEGRTEVAA